MISRTHNLVVVHEDGAVISSEGLDFQVAEARWLAATMTASVVYAHFSGPDYRRVNSYNRERD